MGRMIDQVRASKLPSNLMQFAAKGALSVPAEESIEILVYLAKHNPVFGPVARMTLAGWDEKASLVVAGDPKAPAEVLAYLIAPDNLRPKLLPALLENPSVPDGEIAKLAVGASPEGISALLKSARVRGSSGILEALKANLYLKDEEAATVAKLISAMEAAPADEVADGGSPSVAVATEAAEEHHEPEASADEAAAHEEAVSAYLKEHATEIEQEKDKAFQPVGGIVDLLGADYFPVLEVKELSEVAESVTPAAAARPAAAKRPRTPEAPRRESTLQKIKNLDVKGRIQLALKGSKEERGILIRDGTKVVALAVLEAPKLSDGEVEKFALQKNVLESVLRHIPLKRRFMKNYIVVRNLVSNPRTPLDLGLGLMKHLLPLDLKNISGNKEISETVRKLALKMYKQKLDQANKK
jgi:hypothetical protein